MFANGDVDVKNIDGELYINMWQLTEHLLRGAITLKGSKDENAELVAGVFAVIVQTLADLAIFTLDKESINNVDDVVSHWSSLKDS